MQQKYKVGEVLSSDFVSPMRHAGLGVISTSSPSPKSPHAFARI